MEEGLMENRGSKFYSKAQEKYFFLVERIYEY